MMKRLIVVLSAILLSACNMGVPISTPTVAPTATPSQPPAATPTLTPSQPPTLAETLVAQLVISPTETLTQTFTPTHTLTPSQTFTGTPSDTPFPTDTPLPTDTPVPTETRPPSPTRLPTIGESPTPLPTVTPLPTATFTWTPLPSITPSLTFTPSPVPTDTPALTPTFLPTLTPIPSWTPRPTFTLTPQVAGNGDAFVPIGQRTATPELPAPVLPATQDVTPTFVTAAPGVNVTIPPSVEPVSGEGNPIATSPTALPAVPTFAPTPLPNPVGLIISNPPDPSVRTFALSTGGVPFTFALGDSSTFAQNPVDPNVFVRVDPSGNLHLISDYQAGTEINPGFAPFNASESDAALNKARTVRVVWSRDGSQVAYLVDQWSDGNNREPTYDGVWVADRYFNASDQVFRDCPMLDGCIVNRTGASVYHTIDMAWGLNNALMIRVVLSDENRNGFALLPTTFNEQVQPPIYRYDYAAWSWDGTRILVSGLGADGGVAIRWFDPNTGQVGEPLLNGSAIGLYVSYAVQRPNGQIVALASTGGAVHLIDVSGAALSGDIGSVPPERVAWSPDRSAVLVVTNENGFRRYFLAYVTNSAVTEITDRVGAGLAVEWINQTP